MTTFDDRDKNFENKFAHDEELSFKAGAIRNKMLGLWAAAQLGKKGDEAENYAKNVVEADFGADEHKGLVQKLLADFHAAGLDITEKSIYCEMERLMPLARQKLMGQ